MANVVGRHVPNPNGLTRTSKTNTTHKDNCPKRYAPFSRGVRKMRLPADTNRTTAPLYAHVIVKPRPPNPSANASSRCSHIVVMSAASTEQVLFGTRGTRAQSRAKETRSEYRSEPVPEVKAATSKPRGRRDTSSRLRALTRQHIDATTKTVQKPASASAEERTQMLVHGHKRECNEQQFTSTPNVGVRCKNAANTSKIRCGSGTM